MKDPQLEQTKIIVFFKLPSASLKISPARNIYGEKLHIFFVYKSHIVLYVMFDFFFHQHKLLLDVVYFQLPGFFQ
jgi:hypothetical protein